MSTDARALAIGKAILEMVETIATPKNSASDSLLDVRTCGIERAALRKLERDGRLRVSKIGRRRYVRASDLLALHDELSVERDNKPQPQSYASVVQIAGARKR